MSQLIVVLTTVPQSDWKGPAGRPHSSWLATVRNDIIPQPQRGRCHRAGTGHGTLEIIGSKQSPTLKWCKLNNDDDDDDDENDRPKLENCGKVMQLNDS